MSKETKSPSVRNVDFCIYTFENTDGLEMLLHSIITNFAGARITIADGARNLDRAYYKELRGKLGEAGMLNRLMVHSIGYDAGEARARNFLMSETKNTYKLFLRDDMEISKETDVAKMVEVMKSNKNIGIVGGALDGYNTVMDEKTFEIEGIKATKAKLVSPFILVHRDIQHRIRWNPSVEDTHADFCRRMAKVPYMMLHVPSVKVKIQTNVKTEESNSNSAGETTEPTIPPTTGEPGGSDSVPVGETEKTEDSTSDRSKSRSGTRSVQRESDK